MSNTLKTADLLKQLRKKFNLTIQDVAQVMKVSKAAVSKWETGDGIKTEYLFDLSKLFGVKFSELLNGKLDNESNNDYWRRNYDLSNYDFDEFKIENNLKLLKDFYTHCKIVQEEFFKLLPKFANDTLTQNQQKEFDFLKQYFKFDSNFAKYKKYGYTNIIEFFLENEEKTFVKNFHEEIKNLSSVDYHWELFKLYDFTYDIKSNVVYKSRSLDALKYMLDIMPQVEKDALLMANMKKPIEKEDFFNIQTTRDVTVDEIERIPYYKIMLNGGCNCLFNQSSFQYENWDEDFINYFDGDTKKIENMSRIQCIMDEKKQNNLDEILSWWKICSRQEYLIFVDKERTQYYKDIVNLKNDNPIKYYESLKKNQQDVI